MKLRHLAVALVATVWAAPAWSGEANRGEDGLQHEEITAARSVSRSVFAAQKSERRLAEEAGLTELGQELKRVQASLRALRTLDTEAPRIQVEGSVPSAAAAQVQSQQQQRRASRAASFQHACDDMRAKKEALRGKLAALRPPRQRALALALLKRLDELEPSLELAAAEAATASAASLDALALEIGELDAAVVSDSQPPPPPTFITRTRHRREIPRVP